MSVEVLEQIWPEWKIEGKPLGKGSFGVVYKAVRRDHNIESYAAIKAISIPTDPSEVNSLRSEGLDINATRTYLQSIVNDFVSEIQLMESLKGVQNIVSVEDYKVVEKVSDIGWDIYIRMELLTSFNNYICDKTLAEEEVVKLGCDICTALEICAKRNIIHRDIKPENIFINDFGYFKLGDFGIARKMENLTGGLSQKGTFNYMAPEVANSSEYDARVDIYSLGIVLYRLLNRNRLPFLDTEKQLLDPNERRNAVDRRICGEALPAPCEASPAMADLILRACAYDPDMRFSSATEMKRALMCVANGTYHISANDPSKTVSVQKGSSRYSQTASVRKVSTTSSPKSSSAVNTFCTVPKKKSNIRTAFVSFLTVILLVGVGLVAVPRLVGDADNTNLSKISSKVISKVGNYFKSDNKQIASIISEADTLAANENYEGALVQIELGLLLYPESTELQEKVDAYTKALNAQIKAKTLQKAKTLADSGDYIAAMSLIESAQKSHDEDTDYQAALNTYINAYKVEMINAADAFAAEGNYVDAIAKINEAEAIFGVDTDFSSKSQAYEDEYASSITMQVDLLTETKEFESAFTLVNKALEIFPNNEKLQLAVATIETAQKRSGSTSALNPNQNPVIPKSPEEHTISGASSKDNAVPIQREDVYHSSFTTEGEVAWFKFSTSSNYSAYSIVMLNNSINTSLYITIYDCYDNEIKYQFVAKGKQNYLDVSLESNTEYWLKVHRYSNYEMGNYQFAINEKICDAGMTQADAFYADLGTQYTKALDIHGLCDWYRFTATPNYATYQFMLTNNSIDTTLYLTVYDEYDTEMGSVSASKGKSVILDLMLSADREYTVKLSRYNNEENGYYQMGIVEMLCDAGLQQSEAFPLELNTALYGTADTSFAEWYAYAFTEDGTYTVQLTNSSVDTTVYATVYDVLGTELGSTTAYTNKTSEKSFEISAGTVLYVKISRYDAYCFGNYALLVY